MTMIGLPMGSTSLRRLLRLHTPASHPRKGQASRIQARIRPQITAHKPGQGQVRREECPEEW